MRPRRSTWQPVPADRVSAGQVALIASLTWLAVVGALLLIAYTRAAVGS